MKLWEALKENEHRLEARIGFGRDLELIVPKEQAVPMKHYRKYLVINNADGIDEIFDNIWDYTDSMSLRLTETAHTTAYQYMFDAAVKSNMCTYRNRKMVLIYPEDIPSQFIMWDTQDDTILSCSFNREQDNRDRPCLALSQNWIDKFGSADIDFMIKIAIKKGL